MSKWQEAEGEQGRGRISELAETLNQMEANIAEVIITTIIPYIIVIIIIIIADTLNQMEVNIAEVTLDHNHQ